MKQSQGDFVGSDAKMPFVPLLLAGLQHVLAMFVGVITPPLILAGMLNLSALETAYLVGAGTFVSGITTFIQVRRFGPIGSGLLSVQGTSFVFVPVAAITGSEGLGYIFGMALLALPTQLLIAWYFGQIRKYLPPLVTGTVVLLIGLSLVEFAVWDFAGGYCTDSYCPDGFGATRNYLIAALVIAVLVFVHRLGGRILAPFAILIAGIVGYATSAAFGMVDLSPMGGESWIRFPELFRNGLQINLGLLAPWVVAYAVTSMEAVGDLTATSELSGKSVSGADYRNRIRRGLFADGLGSGLAAIFSTLPNTTFSQNNGVIGLTRIAAAQVGIVVAICLVLLGLSPKIAMAVSATPKPVLGGLTLVLFGLVAASGLAIIGKEKLDSRARLILAISIGLGLGVELVPEAIDAMRFIPPDAGWLKDILKTGFAVGGITAFALNLLLKDKSGDHSLT